MHVAVVPANFRLSSYNQPLCRGASWGWKARGRSYENSTNIVFCDSQVTGQRPASLYISLSVVGVGSAEHSQPFFLKELPNPRKPASSRISLRLLGPVVAVGYCRDGLTGEGSAGVDVTRLLLLSGPSAPPCVAGGCSWRRLRFRASAGLPPFRCP